jgi:hypothetical protein
MLMYSLNDTKEEQLNILLFNDFDIKIILTRPGYSHSLLMVLLMVPRALKVKSMQN